MSKESFFSLRQVNFVLWVGAFITTWHDPTHVPVGTQWIPFAGLIVSLFWPGKRKAENSAVVATPAA